MIDRATRLRRRVRDLDRRLRVLEGAPAEWPGGKLTSDSLDAAYDEQRHQFVREMHLHVGAAVEARAYEVLSGDDRRWRAISRVVLGPDLPANGWRLVPVARDSPRAGGPVVGAPGPDIQGPGGL